MGVSHPADPIGEFRAREWLRCAVTSGSGQGGGVTSGSGQGGGGHYEE